MKHPAETTQREEFDSDEAMLLDYESLTFSQDLFLSTQEKGPPFIHSFIHSFIHLFHFAIEEVSQFIS